MGKGEIARNKLFLLFPQCFLLFWKTFCHFHLTKNCHLQALSIWKGLTFVVWERVKKSEHNCLHKIAWLYSKNIGNAVHSPVILIWVCVIVQKLTFYPFTTQSRLLTTLTKRPFENMEKGENIDNLPKTNFNFSVTFILLSASIFNLDQSNNLLFDKRFLLNLDKLFSIKMGTYRTRAGNHQSVFETVIFCPFFPI